MKMTDKWLMFMSPDKGDGGDVQVEEDEVPVSKYEVEIYDPETEKLKADEALKAAQATSTQAELESLKARLGGFEGGAAQNQKLTEALSGIRETLEYQRQQANTPAELRQVKTYEEELKEIEAEFLSDPALAAKKSQALYEKHRVAPAMGTLLNKLSKQAEQLGRMAASTDPVAQWAMNTFKAEVDATYKKYANNADSEDFVRAAREVAMNHWSEFTESQKKTISEQLAKGDANGGSAAQQQTPPGSQNQGQGFPAGTNPQGVPGDSGKIKLRATAQQSTRAKQLSAEMGLNEEWALEQLLAGQLR